MSLSLSLFFLIHFVLSHGLYIFLIVLSHIHITRYIVIVHLLVCLSCHVFFCFSFSLCPSVSLSLCLSPIVFGFLSSFFPFSLSYISFFLFFFNSFSLSFYFPSFPLCLSVSICLSLSLSVSMSPFVNVCPIPFSLSQCLRSSHHVLSL